MFRAEDRRAGGAQPSQQVDDGRRPVGIEFGRRFVEHEKARTHRGDRGDRDPLLLAARQRAGVALGQVGGCPGRPASRRCGRPSRRAASPGSPGRRRVPRGRSASSRTAGRPPTRSTIPARPSSLGGRSLSSASSAIDGHPSGHLGPDDAWQESGRRQRQCRLAGAGPSRQPDPLAVPDRERHVVERRLATSGIGDRQAVDREGHRPTPTTAATTTRAVATSRPIRIGRSTAGPARRGTRSARAWRRTRAPRGRAFARGHRPARSA